MIYKTFSIEDTVMKHPNAFYDFIEGNLYRADSSYFLPTHRRNTQFY